MAWPRVLSTSLALFAQHVIFVLWRLFTISEMVLLELMFGHELFVHAVRSTALHSSGSGSGYARGSIALKVRNLFFPHFIARIDYCW